MTGKTGNSCGLCEKPAGQSCSACNAVYYCSKEHQKKHWKSHKDKCAPVKFAKNDTLGRHLVASKDLSPGEVILRKAPLVLGPKMASHALCLGCHKKLISEPVYNCTKCGWPVCGKVCETSEMHKGECEVFEKGGYKPYIVCDGSRSTSYVVVTPLRCLLLKQKDPQKFEILMGFQSHLEENLKTPLYRMLKTSLVPLITKTLKLAVTEEEILTVCSILDTNSFDIRDPEGKTNIRGLYPVINLVAHDCTHNAKHIFQGSSFELVLMATMPIKADEIITITYTQTLWGTLARRCHLKQAKHFDCTCRRCSDPTEFGTYAGSIYCSQCRQEDVTDECPKIISTNPLDENAVWKCQKCEHELTAKQMVWGNDALKNEIRQIDKDRPDYFEKFLVKYEDTLHTKNYHVLEVKYALSQMYGNMHGYTLKELSDDLLGRKIKLCQELLEVADVLEPGFSRFRGCLLYDLQAAMVVQAKRDYANDKLTKQEAGEILCEAVKILNESAKILISEPDMKNILEERLEHLANILELD